MRLFRLFLCGGFLLATTTAAPGVFELPARMLGLWTNGIPEYTILGPQIANLSFGVSKNEQNGDYLLQDHLDLDGVSTGWQRFYVEGVSSSPGLLWYCGYIIKGVWARYTEATGPTSNASLSFVFRAIDQSTTHVTWCLDSDDEATAVGQPFSPFPSGCEFCDCGNWTLSLEEGSVAGDLSRLRSSLAFPGAEGHTHSRHLEVVFDRAGPPPPVNESDWPEHGSDFRCDWGGRDGVPVDVLEAVAGGSKCPHAKAMAHVGIPLQVIGEESTTLGDGGGGHAEEAQAEGADAEAEKAVWRRQEGYDHCYVLNEHTDFRLAWTVRGREVHMEVSAKAATTTSETAKANMTWVGIGFRPQGRGSSAGIDAAPFYTGVPYKFGMQGADIVAGFAGAGVVQTYYASLFTGPPDAAAAALAISNASAGVVEGRAVLTFSRALEGTGKLAAVGFNGSTSILTNNADVLWAVGEYGADDNGSSNAPSVEYHESGRGLRIVNWEIPSSTFDDNWRCSNN